MDSSLAPAAYAGTLLLALRLLVEANFFEMMSDLFEVYPLWGVVLSISFLFTSAKLLASSFAFARVCLPVVAAGTSRFLACLSAAATRRASLVREAVVSASRGFVTTLGSTTAAGILSWVLCRLLLPPLLSIARPFARAILGQYAAWESRVLARLGDFADLVCVDMGRRVERRRVLRTRELQWSAQRSRLDQLNDLVALIARNAADAWSESREWLGGRYEHLRPSEFAGRVAITAPEQGPLPPLGLWFRLRHRIDLDVYWADQTIARLDAAMERNQVAIADLERQVAVRSREIRAINDQVRDCRQRARAALVSTSFVRPTQIANFCRQLPLFRRPEARAQEAEPSAAAAAAAAALPSRAEADSPGPAAILPSPPSPPPPPQTPRFHRALLPPPPPSPTPEEIFAAAAAATPVPNKSRKRALLDQARKQLEQSAEHTRLLAEQRAESERQEREDAQQRAARAEVHQHLAARARAARQRYRERHGTAVATQKAVVESAVAEETPLDGLLLSVEPNNTTTTTTTTADPEPSLEGEGDAGAAVAAANVATQESEPSLKGTKTVADDFPADRPDDEPKPSSKGMGMKAVRFALPEDPEPLLEGRGRVEAREVAYEPETAEPIGHAQPVTVTSGSLAEELPEAEQGVAEAEADPIAEEPESPLERKVKADDEPIAEEPESPLERKVKADDEPIAEEPESPLERKVKADDEPIAEEPESPLERKVKADDEPIATEEPEPKISSFSSSTEEEEEDDEAMVDVAFINVPTKSEAEPSHEEEEATMEVEPLLALPIPGPETELGEVMELELTTLAAEEPKTVVHIVPAQESEKAEVFTDLTDTPMPEASFQEEKEEGEEGEKDEAMTVEQHQPAAQAEPFDDQMHIDLPQPWEQQMVTYQMAEEARLDAIDEQYRRADDAEVRAAWQAELEAAEAQRLADEQAERELALALQAAIEEHDRQQAETAERARQEQQAMMEQVALDQARQQQQEAENAAWMQELARIAQMAEAALQKSTQLAERRQREQEQQEEEQALLIAQAAATPAQPAVTAEEAVVATGAGVDSGLEAQAGQPNQEASNSTEEDTDLNEQELSFLMCEGSGFDDFLFGDFSALEEEVNTATQGAEATGTTAATTTTTTTTTTNTAPSFVLTLPSTTPGPAADANHTPVSTTNQADPTPTPEPADQLTIPGLAPPVSEFNFSMDTREAKAKAKAKASDSKPAPAEEAETQQQQQQQAAGASANPARKILPAKGRLAKLRAAGDPRAELADQQQQHQHQQSSANNDASIEEELAALEQGWAEEERQDPEWARAEAEHLARQEEEGKRAKAEARALARAQAALELRQQEEQRLEHAARFATAAASSFGQETIFRPPEPGEEARFDPRAQEARAEAETAIAMRTADEEARRRAASHKIDRDPEPEPEDVVDWGDEEISEEE
ncbi:uncharacterized protein P884DRAFT_298703 [Thermothelomyces heterothallicus CBS 202.75]|uniref:uncharacterized protein n=1 Tax=Thermothelomyces heterothallicus CBS 202.75 TaxID=1149848 RepID=UPI00374485F1